MSAENSNLPLANGKVAPSYFDPVSGRYERLFGVGGALFTKMVNLPEVLDRLDSMLGTGTVEFYFEGDTNYSKSFSESMSGISIANDGLETLTFTINGVTRTIYPGEPYTGKLKPFKEVSVVAKDKYRLEVLK
jgi:hypothetical protein